MMLELAAVAAGIVAALSIIAWSCVDTSRQRRWRKKYPHGRLTIEVRYCPDYGAAILYWLAEGDALEVPPGKWQALALQAVGRALNALDDDGEEEE